MNYRQKKKKNLTSSIGKTFPPFIQSTFRSFTFNSRYILRKIYRNDAIRLYNTELKTKTTIVYWKVYIFPGENKRDFCFRNYNS